MYVSSSSSAQATASNGGIGFFGLLAVVFIFLKLTGYIGWSWWWVLAPLWICPVVVIALWVLILIVLVLIASCTSAGTRAKARGY